MKRFVLLVFVVPFFLSHCKEDEQPVSLIGKWKMDKILFESDAIKVEASLPVFFYSVVIVFSDQGTYSYYQNGQEKKLACKISGNLLTIPNADGSESTFDISFAKDGQSWSYQIAEVSMAEGKETHRELLDLFALYAAYAGNSLNGATTVKASFVFNKANQ